MHVNICMATILNTTFVTYNLCILRCIYVNFACGAIRLIALKYPADCCTEANQELLATTLSLTICNRINKKL